MPHRTAEASARACLAASISEALTDYHRAHGAYPNTLAEMPSGAIKFCDGAKPVIAHLVFLQIRRHKLHSRYQSLAFIRMVGRGAEITDIDLRQ